MLLAEVKQNELILVIYILPKSIQVVIEQRFLVLIFYGYLLGEMIPNLMSGFFFQMGGDYSPTIDMDR